MVEQHPRTADRYGARWATWYVCAAVATCLCLGCGDDDDDDDDGGDGGPDPVPTCDRLGVFGGYWGYTVLTRNHATSAGARRYHCGVGASANVFMVPVAGDFDGNGYDTVGFYDPRAMAFQLFDTNVPGPPDLTIAFGEDGSLPVIGDFDGDGVDTIGVRLSATGEFRLRNSNSAGAPDVTFVLAGGTIPVAGDFDGDGVATVGVYDTTTGTFSLKNANVAGPADLVFAFGPSQDMWPVVGDFDDDGVDTIGVYDPATGACQVRNSNDAGPADVTITLAMVVPHGYPVAGRWDLTGDPQEHSGYAWPVSTPLAQGFVTSLLDDGFTQAAAIPTIHSMLVIRNGFLVREEYFNGFDATMSGNIKSASKSVESAVVGIAWDQGYITSTAQKVMEFLPEYFTTPPLDQVSLAHLLTMSSGITPDESSLVAAWAVEDDWVDTFVGFGVSVTPGTAFYYSTGNTHTMAVLLERETSVPLRDYTRVNLLGPLGISVTRWDLDPQGHCFGGAGVFMRPRDMARFGQLFLDGGFIDGGTEVVPEAWVTATTSPVIQVTADTWYGGWWWIHDFASESAYYAVGHGGQFIVVFPDLEMIIVATAYWQVDEPTSSAVQSAIGAIIEDYLAPSASGG